MPSSYEILFSDGEGAEYTDFNAAQRAPLSPIWRMLNDLGRNSAGTEGWSGSPVNFLAVAGAGDSQPVPGASARSMKLTDGLIMQRSSNTFDPADSNVLAFFVDGPGDAGTTWTHAAADPSLDRWDLVAASLSHQAGGLESRDFKDATTGALSTVSLSKRRNTLLTTQLVTGTPNASPTIPATPGGMLPLYAVRVPAGYNAAFTQEQIIDYRMPLGLTICDVYAGDMWRRGSYVQLGGAFTLNVGGGFPSVNVATIGDQVIFVPSVLGSSSRLLAVGALMSAANTGTHRIERYLSSSSFGGGVLINSLGNGIISTPGSAGSSSYRQTDTTSLANSSQGGVSTPIWSSGAASPLAQASVAPFSRVGVRWTAGAATDSICLMRFIFAGSF